MLFPAIIASWTRLEVVPKRRSTVLLASRMMCFKKGRSKREVVHELGQRESSGPVAESGCREWVAWAVAGTFDPHSIGRKQEKGAEGADG